MAESPGTEPLVARVAEGVVVPGSAPVAVEAEG
jgi:hypothetical protein